MANIKANWLLTVWLLAAFGCSSPKKEMHEPQQTENATPFLLGTYTKGESEGIYRYTLGADGQLSRVGLVATLENPSFLAKGAGGRLVYAVSEVGGEGSVVSYDFGPGDTLQRISVASSGGAHPCHLSVDAKGNVLVANYSGGSIGYLQTDMEAGRLSETVAVSQHEGSGPHERQTAPHAHSVWFRPDSKGAIAVDLGTDELIEYRIEGQERLAVQSKVKMAAGAGPRHLAFHPNGKWLYVINELNSTITQVRNDAGALDTVASFSTLPEGFEGHNQCAHIAVSADGKFVYASNRGHNSLVLYSVAEGGSLQVVGHESVHGDWPRHFALSPDERFIVVANERSGNLASFRRDAQTGLLTFVAEASAPMPVCVLF